MIHNWCQWSHLRSHPVLTSTLPPSLALLVAHSRRCLIFGGSYSWQQDTYWLLTWGSVSSSHTLYTYLHTYTYTYTCTRTYVRAYCIYIYTYVPLLRPHFCCGAGVSSGTCICALCVHLCLVFVGVIEQLFDEEVLIGSGWTARETIRCVEPVERSTYVRTSRQSWSVLQVLDNHPREWSSRGAIDLAQQVFPAVYQSLFQLLHFFSLVSVPGLWRTASSQTWCTMWGHSWPWTTSL